MKIYLPLFFIIFLSGFSSRALQIDTIVPKLSLKYWNSGRVLYSNNCYNYSTNQRTDSFAQPGESGGFYIGVKDLNCPTLKKATEKDLGLEQTKFFPFQGKKNKPTLLALVVAPNLDYHWYRRDDNNRWSHKPGQNPATNKDNSNKIITNPKKADRGIYTQFCSYYKVTNYDVSQHEQDTGYVRIGDMTDFPDLEIPSPAPSRQLPATFASVFSAPHFNANKSIFPASTITVLKYSGRINPTINLSQWIYSLDNNNQNLILDFVSEIENLWPHTFSSILKTSPLKPALGYQGVVIDDKNGILFPEGFSARLKDGVVYLKKNNQLEMIFKGLKNVTEVENLILLNNL